MQKYIKGFDWKSILKIIKILEQKALKNSSATFFNLEKVLFNPTGYLFIRVIRILLCKDRVLLLYRKRNFLHVLLRSKWSILSYCLEHRFCMNVDSSWKNKLKSARKVAGSYIFYKKKETLLSPLPNHIMCNRTQRSCKIYREKCVSTLKNQI